MCTQQITECGEIRRETAAVADAFEIGLQLHIAVIIGMEQGV